MKNLEHDGIADYIGGGGLLSEKQAERFVTLLLWGALSPWYKRLWYWFLYRILRRKPRPKNVFIHRGDGD